LPGLVWIGWDGRGKQRLGMVFLMGTTMKFLIFRDAAGEWRWRCKARNGRIIAESGEGYTRKAMAIKRLHIFRFAVQTKTVPVIVQD
jgi:uncharacterized protein